MSEHEIRNVRDFKKGVKVFFGTIFWGFVVLFIIISLASEETNINTQMTNYLLLFIVCLIFFLAIKGFIINFTPLKVENNKVYIPARDQIRGFMDLITINPITGYFRRREYSINDIENVANGYTRPGRGGKDRSWNVVITGMKSGDSFSQKIDVSNKQVRDEVRNALKHSISGRVNSEFSY